jgi:hypothetical protein
VSEGRFVFPCGASYNAAARSDWKLSAKGRTRLVVADTEPGVRSPLLDGREVACRVACPKRQHRRITKAWPEDAKAEELKARGVSAFSPTYPWRYVTTCLGQWEAATDYYVTVCAECLCSSCWLMIFPCEKAQRANTKEIRASELRELARENADYYSREILLKHCGQMPRATP